MYRRDMPYSMGPKLLQSWRERNKVSQHDLSMTTGISVTGISRYENGAVVPGIHNALLIEKATSGEVPVSSWDTESIVSDEDSSAA